MGYECLFYFHERLEEGGYNKEETKTFKKKVGEPFEDIPLEKLAGAVMAQLSRRDIWITNVEVYEYSKKAITFRETTGGIILKNRKFLVDQGANVMAQDIVEAPSAPEQPQIHPHQLIQAPGHQQNGQGQHSSPPFYPHNGNQLRPIRWVTFSPELPLLAEVKQRGLRFTVDKKYPVFKEQQHPTGIGLALTTLDDNGREQLISDKYFIPAEINLYADREIGFSEDVTKREGGKLRWDGMVDDPGMPKLR